VSLSSRNERNLYGRSSRLSIPFSNKDKLNFISTPAAKNYIFCSAFSYNFKSALAIKGSIKKAEDGTKITKETLNTLDEIVDGIEQASTIYK
jgi:hypothetical protein